MGELTMPQLAMDLDIINILVGVVISLILINGIKKSVFGRNTKLPPGPLQLPIIGNLHLLGTQPHKSLTQLSKKHGPIMLLRLGFKNVVVISSATMAKEVLQKQDLAFSSRASADSLSVHNHDKYSVGLIPVGPLWRTLRKVMNRNMFSGNSLVANEHVRRKKVEELVEYCRKSSERREAVDLNQAAFKTLLNLMSNIIFSKDLDDPLLDSGKEMKELIGKITVEAGTPNLVDFFPFLRPLDPQGIRRRSNIYFARLFELLNVLMDERINIRNSSRNGSIKDQDFIDILLSASENNSDEINRAIISSMCLDLTLAGTDTSSNTLEWAMTEAVRNPETIKRVRQELDQFVGKRNILNEEDIKHLPYLRCMVRETLRLHPPAPFLVPRKVERDVEIYSYVVPKNSLVFVNVWAIGRDADTWADPFEFKPERFLDSGVDLMGTNFELIPFGAGRRICPGLSLAVPVVTVMLGSLLNSFDWKLEDGIRPRDLNMEERFGMALQKAYPLRAIPIPT